MENRLNIAIEKAAVKDILSISQIESSSFSYPWQIELFEKNLFNLWVAKLDRQVTGYILFEPIADEIHITHMAVAPQFRRQGIAKHLLEKALSSPASKYFLEVRENNFAARKLYENFGFKVIDRRKKYYEDGADALVMQKDQSQ